jgi:hypothetical protein
MSALAGSAASFTDDTSLPRVGCRVSIHAQIITENPFNWYFFLKAKAAEGRGEFKRDAIATFFSIADTDRRHIIKTLRNVRIHITDPRPYSAHLSEPLRKVLPRGTSVQSFLKRLDDSTRHLEEMQRKAIAAIATMMLQDSPPERLKYKYKTWEYVNGIRLSPVGRLARTDLPVEPEQERAFDFTPFQHKNANLLSDVANFSSASASVFSSAIDRFDEARNDFLFASPMAGPYLINNALGCSHAFDEGNRRAVKWIEERRADVLAQIDQENRFYPAFLPAPLQELRQQTPFRFRQRISRLASLESFGIVTICHTCSYTSITSLTMVSGCPKSKPLPTNASSARRQTEPAYVGNWLRRTHFTMMLVINPGLLAEADSDSTRFVFEKSVADRPLLYS